MIIWLDGALVPLAEARDLAARSRAHRRRRRVRDAAGLRRRPVRVAAPPPTTARVGERPRARAPGHRRRSATPPTRCSTPTAFATRACGSRSPAGPRHPALPVAAVPIRSCSWSRRRSSRRRPRQTSSIAPWTRNEHGATAGLKTISYAANVRALAYAEERGADEAIFANTQGNLCEATGSNVFVVVDGTARDTARVGRAACSA